ncbi:hypothetical protein GT755_30025 [Herbidospora sp. NEAU-GS84]|uniref:MarR family transcriptional regulator n=1 Tax=Herbidospora solisilvae TaxID=2696284 RepID=A0A7C9JFD9_9ACTN|nr:hypothetical protein [Herbidospora solisilvae]NAS25904.1 hypothetical protein [Herbidospora solisilvae]
MVHQQHIATRLQLEKSSASRLLASLGLTAEGHAIADHIEEHLRERHAQILARLDDSERAALAIGISALARAMRETTAHADRETARHSRGQERSTFMR